MNKDLIKPKLAFNKWPVGLGSYTFLFGSISFQFVFEIASLIRGQKRSRKLIKAWAPKVGHFIGR